MNKTIYLSFTISKDDDENCSLSYRRIKFSVEEIEKIIDTISDIEPTQVKSLKYAFGVIFKEFYKQPTAYTFPSNKKKTLTNSETEEDSSDWLFK